MKEQTARLADDPELRERYEAAARDYVARRDRLEVLQGVPAQGGMPVRVKCLHVLVAHSLAVGPGVNPFGDEALELLPQWWAKGPCVDPTTRTPCPASGPAREGRRGRLRHQLDPPARRRRRRADRKTDVHRRDARRPARPGRRPHRASWRPRRSSAPASRWSTTPRRCRELGVERVRMVATSATRDARNRDDFRAMVQDGARRARRRSSAATRRRRCPSTARRAGSTRRDGPFLVIDIGGGSTELVARDDRRRRRRCRSTSAASG